MNTDNPLGHDGKVAMAYAHLLKNMWNNKAAVVNPVEFKHIIGEYAPQFAGYQQHDSQVLSRARALSLAVMTSRRN